MPLAHWLFRTSLAHPDLPAVALGPRKARSYEELAGAASSLAGWLRSLKLARKTPIAIVSENRVEIVETLFACWWAGHPVAPIDPSLPQEDIAARLAYSEAQVCFASPRAAGKALAASTDNIRHVIEYDGPSYTRARAAPPLDPPPGRPVSDTAWLSFSDRAPGEPPRAAMLSFQALMSLTISILAEIEAVKPRDAQIHALPWTGAAGFTLLPVLARGGVNVMPETGDFDPAELFGNAARWRRASTMVSAQQLRALVASEASMKPEHLRTIEIAGLDVSQALVESALERFGPRLARIFGHSAFPLGLTRLNSHDVSARRDPGWSERIASVGRPFLSTQISIRSGEGPRSLATGEVGWIYARCLHGMRGYWRDRRSRVGNATTEWRRLGLRGALDHRGYLSVLGPAEHLLVGPGGETIAPDAIETALIDQGVADDIGVTRHPGAKMSARASRPQMANEKIIVFLKKSSAAAASLADIGPPLPIAETYEVAALPRSANGRLHRTTLRRWAEERAGAATERDQSAEVKTLERRVIDAPKSGLKRENKKPARRRGKGDKPRDGVA